MKIGILLGSVRDDRNGAAVAEWALDYAESRQEDHVIYELIDLKDYDLPFLGLKPTEEQAKDIERFSNKMASFDGYVFVTPEYNRIVPGAMKNALDYLKEEVENKAVGFVGYGGLGGLSSIQSLRLIAGELSMADVSTMVTFSLLSDFENFSIFKPNDYHLANAQTMFDQVLSWTEALATIRL